jgi:hypothetical protein
MAWLLAAAMAIVAAGLAVALVRRTAAMRELRARLSELEAKAEMGKGGSEPRLLVLWALAQLEQQRAWRLSLAPAPSSEPDGLAELLAMEVDRIREEVGTPGSIDVRLEPPVAADDAVLALLAARELLAVLVPHTQAYDLAVERDGAHLEVEVICDGWEGPDTAADDIGRLLATVAPAGGDLQLEADDKGRLRATLQLPLTA